MDFAFSPDQRLLRDSVRAFLDQHVTPATLRPLWDDPRGESEATWKEMAQLGWLGLALPEAYGGSALGMVETAILLDELGRAAYPGPYLPTMLAAAALEAAGGEARASLALLDADLDWRPEAAATRAEKTATGFALTGTKRFVPWAHVANVLLVPAQAPEGLTLFCVDPAASGVTLAPARTMDPGTRWSSVTLARAPVAADAVLGAPGQAGPLLAALLRRGAVAAAAEMLLEVENSHAAVYYAAWALDAQAEDHEIAASIAKAYVGDAARKVCGEAIQVHGGIGFTWEYDLHIYFKRAKALEAQYGDGDYHRELIVRRVAA